MRASPSAPLPSPKQLKSLYPLELASEAAIFSYRRQIVDILLGRDPRRLLILGPCSIHHVEEAQAYAIQLKQLAEEVEDLLFLVMRVYVEKPRTLTGWTGLIYDPDLNQSYRIEEGLKKTRQLFLFLTKLGLPVAVEFLDPLTHLYFSDLVAWGCIGARTAESQIHCQLASDLPLPMGFKNSTSGSIEVAIQGILAAKVSHPQLTLNESGALISHLTAGNPHGHLVLRGSHLSPNYDADLIADSLQRLEEAQIETGLLIDCSHGNARRSHLNQLQVFQSVWQQIMAGGNKIRGLLLESYHHSGQQQLHSDPKSLQYGISITDPCLDWSSTSQWVRHGYQQLQTLLAAR